MSKKKKQTKAIKYAQDIPRNNKRKNLITVIIIFAITFCWRLIFIFSNIDKKFPFSVFYYGDSIKYHDYAMALLRGMLYDNGFPYHPPLLAWVIAAIYSIIGAPQEMGYSAIPYKIIYSLINSICCVILFYVALQFVNRKIAVIICLLFAMSFGMFVLSATANNENIYILILLLIILLIVKNRNNASIKIAIVLGILNALAALTRAEHLLLFPLVLIYLLINSDKKNYKKAISWCGYSILFFVLTLMPWSIRNYVIITRFNNTNPAKHLEPISPFVLVTNYGALNFAMANNDKASGGFSRELLNKATGEGVLNFNNPQHRYYFIHGYKEGIKWIINNPSNYVKLCIKKLDISFDALALGFTSWDVPSGLNGVRRAVDVFAPYNNWFRYIFICIVGIGFVIMAKRDFKKSVILHLIFVHKIFIIVMFFGYVRQLLSIYPVILLLSCFPLALIDEKKLKIIFLIVIIIVSIGFLVDFYMMRHPKNYIVSGYTDPTTGYIIQDSEIKIMLKEDKVL